MKTLDVRDTRARSTRVHRKRNGTARDPSREIRIHRRKFSYTLFVEKGKTDIGEAKVRYFFRRSSPR